MHYPGLTSRASQRNYELYKARSEWTYRSYTQKFIKVESRPEPEGPSDEWDRYRSLQNAVKIEPRPNPKGPSDIWEWLAYLEDEGRLRWWHLVLAAYDLLKYPRAT